MTRKRVLRRAVLVLSLIMLGYTGFLVAETLQNRPWQAIGALSALLLIGGGAIWGCRGRVSYELAFLSLNVCGLLIFHSRLTSDSSVVYSLLTTIWEGLAAILAIVLSATLVVAQLRSRYSPRLFREVFLKPQVVSYLAVLLAAATLPLALLSVEMVDLGLLQIDMSSPLLVKVALTLAAACLIFSVPYFLFLRQWFSLRTITDELYRRSVEKLPSGRGAPDEAFILREVAVSLWNSRSYEGYRYAINALCNLVVDTASRLGEASRADVAADQQEGLDEIPSALSQLIRMVKHIGVVVKGDPLAAMAMVDEIGRSAIALEGLVMEEASKHRISGRMLEGIEQVVRDVAELRDEVTLESIAFLVGGIGHEAAAQGRSVTAKRLVRDVLVEISSVSLERGWDGSVSRAVGAIYYIGMEAVRAQLPNLVEEALTRLGQAAWQASDDGRLDLSAVADYRYRGLVQQTIDEGLLVPRQTAFGLSNMAQRGVVHGKPQVACGAVGMLTQYCKVAMEEVPEGVARYCVRRLTLPLLESWGDYFISTELIERVIGGLGTVGQEAVKRNKEGVLREAIVSLKRLARKMRTAEAYPKTLIAAELWTFGCLAWEREFPQESIEEGLRDIAVVLGQGVVEEGFEKANVWVSFSADLAEFSESL